MNRITRVFNQGKVFAVYLTAGDGRLNEQMGQIRALIAGGVNLLEIGIPFSDPIADGPVIQQAMLNSLKAGTTLKDVLELVKAVRSETEIPIILFTYLNPILSNQDLFLQKAKDAGVDGILVVDLPFFEAKEYLATCADLDLAPICVITPSTEPQRLQEIAQQGKGFIYYACRKGTTGARDSLPAGIQEKISHIKFITSLPVIIGFGIADPATSHLALTLADGFVVGSHFIDLIRLGITHEALTQRAMLFTF